MRLELDWHPAARRDFLYMPRQAATHIDAAILRFAETQEGDFVRIWPNDPYGIRLFAPGAVAVLYVDVEERVLRVGRVFRRR